MKTVWAAPLAAVLVALLNLPMHAESLDDIYAKAKAEGALSIYGGGPARLYEGWVKEFEARFPGIKVTVTGGYAGGLAPAIDKQIAARKLEVDFVTFQAVTTTWRPSRNSSRDISASCAASCRARAWRLST